MPTPPSVSISWDVIGGAGNYEYSTWGKLRGVIVDLYHTSPVVGTNCLDYDHGFKSAVGSGLIRSYRAWLNLDYPNFFASNGYYGDTHVTFGSMVSSFRSIDVDDMAQLTGETVSLDLDGTSGSTTTFTFTMAASAFTPPSYQVSTAFAWSGAYTMNSIGKLTTF